MRYIIQDAVKSRCPQCNNITSLLCEEYVKPNTPLFYICWHCHKVYHVGAGEVLRDDV